MWKLNYPFYSADDSLSVSLDDKPDDDKIPDEDEEIPDVNEPDPDDKEDKEDKEDEPELSRFTLEDIKTAFKDKPELLKQAKHAFFREQQFTETFPTIEDARKAAEAQAAYEELTAAVIDGDAKTFITELNNESGEGLKKFAENFLPALQENDKDLFLDITQPIVQDWIRRAYGVAVRDKDTNAANAAKIIHRLIFGGSYDDIEKDVPLVRRDRTSTKDDKDEEGKKNLLNRRYSELNGEVTNLCYSKLEEEIAKGLDDLTKTKPGLKKLIMKDVKDRILEAMEKDAAYLSRMSSLWKREQRQGFSGTLKSSFLTTFLGKARTLIPKYRAEARKDALGKEDVEDKEVHRPGSGRQISGNKGQMTVDRVKKENLTTRQIFD